MLATVGFAVCALTDVGPRTAVGATAMRATSNRREAPRAGTVDLSRTGIPVAMTCVLIVATLRWPLAARLALAFDELGCQVQAWCPAGHPLECCDIVERRHRARRFGRQASLRAAIDRARPDLIIACDDAATVALQQLHRHLCDTGTDPEVALAIGRSLGAPEASALATDRGALMRAAQAAGVLVPECATVGSAAELAAWCGLYGFPAVLKVDGTFGGLGVAVVRDAAAAERTFREFSAPRLLPALSQWILRRDHSHLLAWLRRKRPTVTVQRHISGTPANRAVACWRGAILAGTSVAAVETLGPTGPATVVRMIDDAAMAVAATRLVGALGLSGLCGLDFILEAGTGRAYLIEVNPRATPIGHLVGADAQDLPALLCAAATGLAPTTRRPSITTGLIALFPGECHRDPRSVYLHTAFHDVPWVAPALVADGMRAAWEQRGLAARARAWLRTDRQGRAQPPLSSGVGPVADDRP